MLALLGTHAVVAVALLGRNRRHRGAPWAAALPLLLAAVWLAVRTPEVIDGGEPTQDLAWVPDLGLEVAFRLDGLALLWCWMVVAVGIAVVAYAAWYLGGEESTARTLGLLVGFAGAMLGLALADDLLTFYVAWELTTWTSFLLIGVDDRDDAARRAARQALLVTSGGGLGMLGGFLLLADAAGTTSFGGVLEAAPSGGVAQLGLVGVLLGAAAKSALVPLHAWLPAAMAAPTPVSAYLHAATMVTGGVLLAARFAPAYAETVHWWWPVVLAVGASSFVLGAVQALREHDLKRILAFGTVSELGFLFLLFGHGSAGLASAGAALLLAHALFKSALFFVVGVIDHACHTRDVRRLRGLARRMPLLLAVAGLAAASMAGVPPLAGFVAHDHAFAELQREQLPVALVLVVAGSILTVAYATRFVVGAFGPFRPSPQRDHRAPAAGAGRPAVAAVLALTVGTVLAGLVPRLVSPLVQVATEATTGERPEPLALWAGVRPALGLTVLSVVAGVACLRLAPLIRPLHRRISDLRPRLAGPAGRAGGAVTATTHRLAAGRSLPGFLLLVLLTAAVAVVVPLALEGPGVGGTWTGGPAEVGLAVLVLCAATAGVTARGRFAVVVLLGTLGFGVSGLFLLLGAVELAIVQILIDSAAAVVYLVLLHRLPEQEPGGPKRERRRHVPRVLVAAAFGTAIAVTAVVATTNRRAPPVGDVYVREAGGDIVAAILVDYRGFDTLGELSVAAIAAFGVITVLRSGTGRQNLDEHAFQPSPIVDLGTRLLLPGLVLLSLYFLFSGTATPGGGFGGGLVLGAALTLRYLARGTSSVAALVPLRPDVVLGGAVLVALGAGAVGWSDGGQYLTDRSWEIDPPLTGAVSLHTSLLFELALYLAVTGVFLAVLRLIGTHRP